jgi:cytochrome c biogenesis protein CcmG/thiol:disulfide interchange protein DsbE
MTKYLLPLGIFIVIVGFLAVGLKLDPKHIPSPFIGKPAPDFTLPVLHDPTQRVSVADLKGQVWLLNVWASWCVSCRAEHEVVKRMVADNEVPVYGLNYKDERADAIAWLSQLGNPYIASLADTKGDVGIDWGVYGVPETFVVDKAGIVRYKQVGPLTDEVVQETILPLLKELNASPTAKQGA